MAIESIRAERLAKAGHLLKAGSEPYPAHSERTHEIAAFLTSHTELEASKSPVAIAGRIMSMREHGGVVFIDLYDGSGKVQGYLKRDVLGDDAFSLFQTVADVGDFIELSGRAFTTQRGMPSLEAGAWRMLTKSIRPIPDQWYGLKDEDERYRKRYLDIILTPELTERIRRRSVFWNAIRQFLLERDFIEVETPVFENTTGGADARPFVTHHNALDIDVYLRISAGELWQKKLMVAGLPKTFEIGRIFRNEGMSAEHLQDYTQMEFYWAYADYEMGMQLVEDLYRYVAQKTFGTLQFRIGAFDVDLGARWDRYDYVETIKTYTNLSIESAELPELEAKLHELGVAYDSHQGWNKVRAIDALWKYCRKQIGGPGFLVGIPKELSPLAKSDPRNPAITQRFQPIIAGSELGNGYSELNDPIDQAQRFADQERLREAGDTEAQMNDTDFVEALEYGMPPTCGFGMSERVFSFLSNVSVREAQAFPLMRPRGQQT